MCNIRRFEPRCCSHPFLHRKYSWKVIDLYPKTKKTQIFQRWQTGPFKKHVQLCQYFYVSCWLWPRHWMAFLGYLSWEKRMRLSWSYCQERSPVSLRGARIVTSRELFNWCSSSLRRIECLYITEDEISVHDDKLTRRFELTTPIKGTYHLHLFIPVSIGILTVLRISSPKSLMSKETFVVIKTSESRNPVSISSLAGTRWLCYLRLQKSLMDWQSYWQLGWRRYQRHVDSRTRTKT